MGKLDALKTEVDDATKKFEDCQNAYATEMFTFISKEREYTEKLKEVVHVHVCTCTCRKSYALVICVLFMCTMYIWV